MTMSTNIIRNKAKQLYEHFSSSSGKESPIIFLQTKTDLTTLRSGTTWAASDHEAAFKFPAELQTLISEKIKHVSFGSKSLNKHLFLNMKRKHKELRWWKTGLWL